jgi:hydrogenase nickel incorporation protein HypB
MSEGRKVIAMQESVLAENQRAADLNREEFARRSVLVVNVVSSPGSGKTALLERTLEALNGQVSTGVIVGDLATDSDAKRLEGKGAKVVQITTDGYCHLDAAMIERGSQELGLTGLELLIIENVGNLVCPAAHDLGEDIRVGLLSVTEGEDKPLKYPVMFKTLQAAVVSKVDLASAAEFDLELALRNLHEVAPQARVMLTSAKSGEGMEEWVAYLRDSARRKKH